MDVTFRQLPQPNEPVFDLVFAAGQRVRPFSPAWNGTRTTVGRALRLIAEEIALDGEKARVEDLTVGSA